jgi:pteridine reductase
MDTETDDIITTALITGGAKRLGKAMAIALHEQGYSVIVQYRYSEEDAFELCDELNDIRDDSAFCFQCDLRVQEDLEALVDFSIQNSNAISLLVNNASLFYPTPIDNNLNEAWHDIMDTNLKAPFFLSQGLAEELEEHFGNIVNIVDIYGERPLNEHSIYSISKAALIMQTKSLAIELGPNVRVNGIAPGVILWPEGGQSNTQEILDKTALKKQGSEYDIVEALLYLNNAEYVTGQIIQVDGGRILTI